MKSKVKKMTRLVSLLGFLFLAATASEPLTAGTESWDAGIVQMVAALARGRTGESNTLGLTDDMRDYVTRLERENPVIMTNDLEMPQEFIAYLEGLEATNLAASVAAMPTSGRAEQPINRNNFPIRTMPVGDYERLNADNPLVTRRGSAQILDLRVLGIDQARILNELSDLGAHCAENGTPVEVPREIGSYAGISVDELSDENNLVNVPYDVARILIRYGIPVFSNYRLRAESRVNVSQDSLLSSVEELEMYNKSDWFLAILHDETERLDRGAIEYSNFELHSLPSIRSLFLTMAQIQQCLRQKNIELLEKVKRALLKAKVVCAKKKTESNMIRMQRLEGLLQGVATDIEINDQSLKIIFCHPNLLNAFVYYRAHMFVADKIADEFAHNKRKSVGELIGDMSLGRMIEELEAEEHHFKRFIAELLRPYARVFLLITNPGSELMLPVWEGDPAMPEIIRRYAPSFRKIICRLEEQRLARLEREKSKDEKKRERSQARDLRVLPGDNSSHRSIQLITQDDLEKRREQLKREQKRLRRHERKMRNEEPEKAPSAEAWKNQHAEQELQRQAIKKEKAERLAEADRYEQERKHRADIERRREEVRPGRILALSDTEHEAFQRYLAEQNITTDPVYRALISPSEHEKTIEQSDVNFFFRRLCQHIKNFLVKNSIGDLKEIDAFVKELLSDLLGTEHAYHASGQSDLPANYIAHRRIPLIYTGVFSITQLKQLGNDGRAAFTKYLLRLMSQMRS